MGADEMLGGKINLAISDCGDAATHGHVSSISPTFVTKGKKSVVSGTGHLDTIVTDGSFDFDIKFGDMSVHKCTGDICSSSKYSFPMGTGSIVYHGLNCPVAEGDVTMDFDVRVSRVVLAIFFAPRSPQAQVQWTKRSPCEGNCKVIYGFHRSMPWIDGCLGLL